jgi:hypothetical protein
MDPVRINFLQPGVTICLRVVFLSIFSAQGTIVLRKGLTDETDILEGF